MATALTHGEPEKAESYLMERQKREKEGSET